ncbi:MAG TPA: pirin family protein [Polyangia bacterium]|jgi:redox-sensitive bicupin YhaK (pirin superfamily)|nr:pirin family protein [Polyangia bacterium]
MLASQTQTRGREIVQRTRGRKRGPITRLVSPSDLGEVIKPFVFLDHAVFGDRDAPMDKNLLWHPHSGIATVTVVLEGSIEYAETTGKSGVVASGGVEWMRAGNGVWHTGAAGKGEVRVFQLWVALPPELENGPVASHYLRPEEIPSVGPARVILGSYDGATSPIAAPPLTYLSVELKAGERWSYHPATGETVAWVAVDKGTLRTPAPVVVGEVAIFEPSEESLDFLADGDTRFVLGSAERHRYDLALGNYSVHTSEAALLEGEAEIRRIGRRLLENGTLQPLT